MINRCVLEQSDGNYLSTYNATIERQKSEITKYKNQIKKLKKELSKYDPDYR